MKTIKLVNEEYFGYNIETNDIESKGFLTGTYILSKHIKCENFRVVFCPDSKETILIGNNIFKQY